MNKITFTIDVELPKEYNDCHLELILDDFLDNPDQFNYRPIEAKKDGIVYKYYNWKK